MTDPEQRQGSGETEIVVPAHVWIRWPGLDIEVYVNSDQATTLRVRGTPFLRGGNEQ